MTLLLLEKLGIVPFVATIDSSYFHSTFSPISSPMRGNHLTQYNLKLPLKNNLKNATYRPLRGVATKETIPDFLN